MNFPPSSHYFTNINTSFSRKISVYVFLLTLIAYVSSCSRNEKIDNASEAFDTIIFSDTIASTENAEEEIFSGTTKLDALHFINESRNKHLYARGIFPRMADENLPYLIKLLHNNYQRFIVVDKGKMTVFLYDKFGNKEKSYRMACAKNYGTKHKKADSRTPEGFFSVEGIYDSTDWLFTDDDGVTSKKKGQFGPRFIRIRIPSTSQIGIHGTCAPWSIGSRCSHGCIRITNENILELVELVKPGMPVIIIPGSKDMRVNMDEGFEVPTITTEDRPTKIASPNSVPQKEIRDSIEIYINEERDSIIDTSQNEIIEPTE